MKLHAEGGGGVLKGREVCEVEFAFGMYICKPFLCVYRKLTNQITQLADLHPYLTRRHTVAIKKNMSVPFIPHASLTAFINKKPGWTNDEQTVK